MEEVINSNVFFSHSRVGRQNSFKTLNYTLPAQFSRHCVLNCGAQRRILSDYQSDHNENDPIAKWKSNPQPNRHANSNFYIFTYKMLQKIYISNCYTTKIHTWLFSFRISVWYCITDVESLAMTPIVRTLNTECCKRCMNDVISCIFCSFFFSLSFCVYFSVAVTQW